MVVFDFLDHFRRGIGCDTSPEMIEQAKRDAFGRGTDIQRRTRFFVIGAEACSEPLEAKEGQVTFENTKGPFQAEV